MHSTTVWRTFELAFAGPAAGNPFLEVELSAEFSNGGRSVTVPGFYDGDGTYKLRFLPDAQGNWHFTTRSNAPELDGQSGTLQVAPARAGDHGPVRTDGMQFRYADGTRFINLGTTAYAWNHQTPELQEQTLQTLADAPFTKMRMCVFPKHYRYNETEPEHYPFKMMRQGKSAWPATQAESGWDWDFDQINPAFFQHLETCIARLGELGIEADLILMHPYDRWGFDHMAPEQDDRYLKYVVSRLAAYPNVWWSMANEYDLMPNKSLADWDRYIRIVSETDAHSHLLSNHNCFKFFDFSNPAVTHCSIQHEYTYMASKWRETYDKPVSIDECCYEGDIAEAWGNITGQELVHRFWDATVNGAGCTHGECYYNDSETVWWGKGGTMIGDSVARIAFLKQILEDAPDGGLEPMEWTFPYRMTVAGDREHITMPRATKPPSEQADWSPRMIPMFPIAGQKDAFYLVYFGNRTPHEFKAALPPDQTYAVELIDTWNMTRTPFGEARRADVLTFTPKPFQALIFKRA